MIRRSLFSLSSSFSSLPSSSTSSLLFSRSYSPLLSLSSSSSPSPLLFSSSRCYSSEPPKQEQTQEEPQQGQQPQQEENKSIFASRAFKASILVGITSVVSYKVLSDKRKELKEKREIAKLSQRSLGLPDIGGPFTMVNQDGKVVTDSDYKGKFTMMYFGFTFCPEICPAEMIKMSQTYDALTGPNSELSKETQDRLSVLFVSVDPWRDSVHQVNKYVKKYHKKFEGVTGTPEQVSRICKTFRVYSSKPDQVEVDSGMDYLVDHSIFIYLMDPNGRLLGYYGQDKTAEDVFEGVTEDIKAFEYRQSL